MKYTITFLLLLFFTANAFTQKSTGSKSKIHKTAGKYKFLKYKSKSSSKYSKAKKNKYSFTNSYSQSSSTTSQKASNSFSFGSPQKGSTSMFTKKKAGGYVSSRYKSKTSFSKSSFGRH